MRLRRNDSTSHDAADSAILANERNYEKPYPMAIHPENNRVPQSLLDTKRAHSVVSRLDNLIDQSFQYAVFT